MRLKTIWNVGISILRNLELKIRNPKGYNFHWIYSCPVSTSITLEKNATLSIGRHLSARRNLEITVRDGGDVALGDNVNFNNDCMIACRNHISIGNDVIFGPGCKLYDHDHNYKKKGMERRLSMVTGYIRIGDGVWFGADCIVLKDTVIGDNCVFGAGSVIKGTYPPDTLVVQKIVEEQKAIDI